MEEFISFIGVLIWACIIAAICLVLLLVISVFGLVSGFFASAYQIKTVLQEAHRTEK